VKVKATVGVAVGSCGGTVPVGIAAVSAWMADRVAATAVCASASGATGVGPVVPAEGRLQADRIRPRVKANPKRIERSILPP